MDMIRFLSSALVIICFLIHTPGADKYTDENRPYEFGFKIDGQQHRHEKKDKNGIIMGEFGFITADDVYHVTVYATDEQGRFKILSMKNIHLKDIKSVTSVRQGHSLQIPSTHQTSSVQVTTTTTQPIKTIAQEFEPVSLEPPANSCSHCSLPTTSTAAPKPLLINQASGNNGYNTFKNGFDAQNPQSQTSYVESNSLSPKIATQQTSIPGMLNTFQSNQPNYNNYGFQQNSPSVTSGLQDYPQTLQPAQNYPTREVNRQGQNYPSVSEHQSYPSAGTAGQNYPSVPETQQNYTPQGINGQSYIPAPEAPTFGTPDEQNYSQGTQKNKFPTANNARDNYPQRVGTQQNYQAIGARYPQEGLDTLQPTIQRTNSFNSPQYTPQGAEPSNVKSLGTNSQNNKFSGYINTGNSQTIQHSAGQTPGGISPDGNIPGIRTPKQFSDEGEAVHVLPGQKPTLAYAQMQIVDKNTDIHSKAPGETEGLPQGLTKTDMVRLLYTFNYTLGFQGHFEEGYSNGIKQGYYFVTGRNGVRTRIDYVADDKGFHPKISQDVLDLLSDDVPKPETEKQAKYGLKGYEFKWLYYPLDSKKR